MNSEDLYPAIQIRKFDGKAFVDIPQERDISALALPKYVLAISFLLFRYTYYILYRELQVVVSISHHFKELRFPFIMLQNVAFFRFSGCKDRGFFAAFQIYPTLFIGFGKKQSKNDYFERLT